MIFIEKDIWIETPDDKTVFLAAITRITRKDCETLLTVLKAGINCSPLQNKPEGMKILELIQQLEAYLKG